ncbi:lysine transporter LysE [Agaricicola taiwanensis]|uniref:Lysine transporter LysE n=1 Tax=Agaricicola taiwanensis TaxID=591372 RepID=A0A8J2YLF9_9RHOB|nr:LysE family translocator [Agaricicola taiwanensis]GGE51253.1 lysine transporter LysE [Agaricicola taiwanensis]
MPLSSLLLFAAAYFAVVALPGPGVTALVARVLAKGIRGAPAYTAGFATGSLTWFTLAATGLAALAQTFSTLFLVIKYAGVAYLLYMAWKLWKAPVGEAKAVDETPDSLAKLYLTGLAVNLGNPKAVVFFLALLPTLVDLQHLTLVGAAELAGIIVTTIFSVFTAYAVTAARARRFFTSPHSMKLANRASSLVMAGAAAAVVAR